MNYYKEKIRFFTRSFKKRAKTKENVFTTKIDNRIVIIYNFNYHSVDLRINGLPFCNLFLDGALHKSEKFNYFENNFLPFETLLNRLILETM